MKTLAITITLALSSTALAQTVPQTREYSRTGEISPGTEAPNIAGMLAVINGGSPEKLKATLEYGERVLCQECVPLLENKLLTSPSPKVREMAAWWLRRQPFAGPAILKKLKSVVATDPVAQRRAYAAEALGEFMDINALGVLGAASKDPDATVRAAAVRGLGRLNAPGAGELITAAFADSAVEVRSAALDVVLLIAGFRGFAPLLPLLNDLDAAVRAHAARVIGELKLADAAATLSALLMGDASAPVRKSAAWALGRIGGATAATALQTQKVREQDPFVISAIEVAERMK